MVSIGKVRSKITLNDKCSLLFKVIHYCKTTFFEVGIAFEKFNV